MKEPSDRRQPEGHRSRGQVAALVRATTAGIVVPMCVVALYAILPLGHGFDASAIALIVTLPLVAIAVVVWQLWRIHRSDVPLARAFAGLLISFTLIVIAAAVTYLSAAGADPSAFSEPLSKIDAVYFSVVTMATVGFGDIHPVSGLARLITTTHIVVSVLFVGAGINVLINAARHRARRLDQASSAPELRG